MATQTQHWNEVYERSNDVMTSVANELGVEFSDVNDVAAGFFEQYPIENTAEEWDEIFEKFELYLHEKLSA